MGGTDLTQNRLDEIWQRFLAAGRPDDGFICISNGRLDHITDSASDTTWERKTAGSEWKPVFPLRTNP
jgi:hypothetical protein